MVASVPLFTKRMRSSEGMNAWISSASSTSPSDGVPKEVPCAAAACTACTTTGWAWPSSSGPQDST
jgi:hypothetical protein